MGIKEIAKLKEWSLNSTWDDRKNSEKLKKDGRQKFVASYFILTESDVLEQIERITCLVAEAFIVMGRG